MRSVVVQIGTEKVQRSGAVVSVQWKKMTVCQIVICELL
jgi:hypothetical protein